MKKVMVIACLCMVTLLSAIAVADAEYMTHTKLTPYGLTYPNIIPGRLTVPGGIAYQRNLDAYRQSFGVRRMFRGIRSRDYDTTLLETLNWHALYGGFGVTGHGEEVFTNWGEKWRQTHQGN